MTTIESIKNNPSNRQFFAVAEIHTDKGYEIVADGKRRLLRVKTDRGYAHYSLKGSMVGNYTSINN